MKKLLIAVAIVVGCLAGAKLAEGPKFTAPTLTLVENIFPDEREDGLQIYALDNPNDFPVVLEVECLNAIDAPEFRPLGLGKLSAEDKVVFPVLIYAAQVSPARPVEAQCHIKKWVKWD